MKQYIERGVWRLRNIACWGCDSEDRGEIIPSWLDQSALLRKALQAGYFTPGEGLLILK